MKIPSWIIVNLYHMSYRRVKIHQHPYCRHVPSFVHRFGEVKDPEVLLEAVRQEKLSMVHVELAEHHIGQIYWAMAQNGFVL